MPNKCPENCCNNGLEFLCDLGAAVFDLKLKNSANWQLANLLHQALLPVVLIMCDRVTWHKYISLIVWRVLVPACHLIHTEFIFACRNAWTGFHMSLLGPLSSICALSLKLEISYLRVMLDYCNSLLSLCPKNSLKSLQLIQKHCSKSIVRD